ncbi:hypothetical protein D8O27_23150 [Burkholderia mallei]|uniref:50S ribosomal protein L34 n=2 Tax=pseudomallei group TaxID=111527 RepID=A0AAX1XD47_BURML|nr:hypothetical protein BOC35_15505 [Burkholderia pseudomallei]EEP84190.1 conserved hypothetical protein [Burkholderia mallei GB8 horse 4]EXI97344.1 hypothetical protein T210_0140510 [Burkholderia pseudomallei MSHR6137]PNX03740.1 hypothetical protein CF649_11185 [Burkholderia sp. 136(2017)]PNX15764.1 hypothetical protein CF650_09985 [Burkholderia sp. 129]PNX30244.1 hypothetical protein CF647_11230 [Burkholderia sp. 117]PNX39269.1 hypothetical protein CF648_11185 [Burkholderia sp. 137]RKN9308
MLGSPLRCRSRATVVRGCARRFARNAQKPHRRGKYRRKDGTGVSRRVPIFGRRVPPSLRMKRTVRRIAKID